MLTGGSDQLVGDRQEHIELVPPGQLQIRLHLIRDQFIAAGLDLHQCRPGPAPIFDPDRTVWAQPPVSLLELHLDEGR